MARLVRAFVVVLTVCALVFVSGGVALAATVAVTGFVTVQVDEPGPDGVDLYIPVPALVIDLGMATLPMLIPEDELADIRHELRDVAPSLLTLANELEDCPDATLVKVETDEEMVSITKQGNRFRVDIDSQDANIHVTLPTRMFGKFARLVAS